jgi:hypothetical protein
MLKLATLVMGSAFLGLSFATVCKGDPPAESAPRGSNQISVIQHMIDASEREDLKSIMDKLDDLERRIKDRQSLTSSDNDRPCPPGSVCSSESEPDRELPCRSSTCERVHNERVHDKEWPCPGAPSCARERVHRVDIHVYKHVYIHKPIYRHVYWQPRYYPPPWPWDDCDW